MSLTVTCKCGSHSAGMASKSVSSNACHPERSPGITRSARKPSALAVPTSRPRARTSTSNVRSGCRASHTHPRTRSQPYSSTKPCKSMTSHPSRSAFIARGVVGDTGCCTSRRGQPERLAATASACGPGERRSHRPMLTQGCRDRLHAGERALPGCYPAVHHGLHRSLGPFAAAARHARRTHRPAARATPRLLNGFECHRRMLSLAPVQLAGA